MHRKLPIFYNALLLTGVNLLLRFAGTGFQVYLSGRIGAEGIGLLQLILSVGALALTVGMGGIRTATMYLCAEVVGQKRTGRMGWVLSGCILYSFTVSSCAAMILYLFAPQIASVWIGNSATVTAIRTYAMYLPVCCLCGVMVGYYTGVNRIGTLAAVEVAEQFCAMTVTVLLLKFWAGSSAIRACQAVIFGSSMGACITLSILVLLKKEAPAARERLPMLTKLRETAVPLAIADTAKAGISTAENLMVPKRLALHRWSTSPLADFGMICGMVFPVLMFPAAILFGLAELLIPEMARCQAAGSNNRIRYLAERSLLLATVYGCFCGGIIFLYAKQLCIRLYQAQDAVKYMQWFALLAPMLYCDAIVDAITKGLGQQKICVRYNILTSAMDVVLLFFLLPRYGLQGYFTSFLVTHFINFLLSIRLLQKLIWKLASFRNAVFAVIATGLGVLAGSLLPGTFQFFGFSIVFGVLLMQFGVVKRGDYIWLMSLAKR